MKAFGLEGEWPYSEILTNIVKQCLSINPMERLEAKEIFEQLKPEVDALELSEKLKFEEEAKELEAEKVAKWIAKSGFRTVELDF